METFISGLQQQMVEGLEKLDRGMPKNKSVTILGKGNKGLIRLSPFEAAPEPFNIKQLKGEINRLWHKTSLLDILKETDLRVDFTRNFKSMGTREILDRETLQKRLLLCLFGMGTNTGLKRINTGVDGENYPDLVYVRRRYIHKDQLRSAIAEVVNAIFEIRLPHIWGEGTTGYEGENILVIATLGGLKNGEVKLYILYLIHPEIFKSLGRHLSVADCVVNVFMTQIILNCSSIMPLSS